MSIIKRTHEEVIGRAADLVVDLDLVVVVLFVVLVVVVLEVVGGVAGGSGISTDRLASGF